VRHIDRVSGDGVDAAISIHRQLGPGLLESVYETVLAGKLSAMGYDVARQFPVAIEFEGLRFENAFKIDLLVDGQLIVEVKSVERVIPVHAKQLLTYLRLMEQPVGLLLNFGCETMKEGIRRLVNNYDAPAPSAPLREQN